MSTIPLWSKEFDLDYAPPPEILALVTAGQLVDTSWHNDVCPSFGLPGRDLGVRIWSEHPLPDQRESQYAHRFAVSLYDEQGDYLDDAIQTDSVDELLFYLKDHWDIETKGSES